MKKFRKVVLVIALILLFFFVTIFLLYRSYLSPVSNNAKEKEIVVENGMTSLQIGKLLKENNLIKNDKFFVLYLKINKVNDLKAGTYTLKENMNLKKIVEIIQKGDSINKTQISITFKEGINMRQIAKVIADNTNNTEEQVMELLKDKNYLNSLIEDYWFITDKILDTRIYYPLEGYLFPDTYNFRSKNVTVEEIFSKMLDQMKIVLEPYKETIESKKLVVHEILTLASIAEKEVNNKEDRKNVVSVFQNRLKKEMPLGSDITTRYGLKLDDTRPLTKSEYNSFNAYNTRNSNLIGLPASPIATVSKESIEASIKPAQTKYLYFISDITTNKTYFFTSSREFEQKKAELSSTNNGY